MKTLKVEAVYPMVFETFEDVTRPATAVAHDFPKRDVGPNCRSASNQQRCMADEQEARGQLVREWGQIAAGDKTSCTQTVTDIAGAQSYVELLTCLEMARDVRKLPEMTARRRPLT
jgi:hypothetical protein